MQTTWTILEKVLAIAACLFGLTLLAKTWTGRIRNQDGVKKDAEPLYHDRDVVGQSRDWLNMNKVKDKRDLPLSNSNNILLLLAAIFMVWILLRIGWVI